MAEFKIMQSKIRREHWEGPVSIPWEMIASHEAQAHRNHSQSLATLDSRGGLCPSEAMAVLENREWPWRGPKPNESEEGHKLQALLDSFLKLEAK